MHLAILSLMRLPEMSVFQRARKPWCYSKRTQRRLRSNEARSDPTFGSLSRYSLDLSLRHLLESVCSYSMIMVCHCPIPQRNVAILLKYVFNWWRVREEYLIISLHCFRSFLLLLPWLQWCEWCVVCWQPFMCMSALAMHRKDGRLGQSRSWGAYFLLGTAQKSHGKRSWNRRRQSTDSGCRP